MELTNQYGKKLKEYIKWDPFLGKQLNKNINNANSKIIELYKMKADLSSDNFDKIFKIDAKIESWKYVIEFNRDIQRLERYPISVGLFQILLGVIGGAIVIMLSN